MDTIPTALLVGVLVVLIALAAFFSGSETALMTLNRYRLRHFVRHKHRGALRAEKLLSRPDRFIGLVLIGNNLVNNFAIALATLIALRYWGDTGVAVVTGVLTLLMLVFSEVTPKTLAALHPERIAFPASHVLAALLYLLWPFVALVNFASNGLLRLIGVSRDDAGGNRLTQEEMKTVLYEAGGLFSKKQRNMLLRLVDINLVEVEDIMIPRQEIEFVDLSKPWGDVLDQLANSPYTRLPVCMESVDQLLGVLHLRRIARRLGDENFNADELKNALQEPYFAPHATPLSKQLLNFQASREHMGLVVNDYGDTVGLVTMEDILEEVVGEFTDKALLVPQDIYPQDDGSYLVEGSATMREINRRLDLHLPLRGPKTLNGAILEYLEDIPTPGTSIKLAGYPVEIVQTKGNAVKIARLKPRDEDPDKVPNAAPVR